MSFLAVVIWSIALAVAGGVSLADRTATGTGAADGIITGKVLFFGDRKWPKAPVYLLDEEQSRPLRRLLRETQRRLRSIGQGNPGTIDVEIEFYDKVAELVPKLPRTAKVLSDETGQYRFTNVAPGQRYYLVAMKVTEDGVFYAAVSTPVLKSREQLRIDVREINVWYAEEEK